MGVWRSAALVFAICAVGCAAATATAASCRLKRGQTCFDPRATINFSAVPDISKEIVRQEPAAEKPKTNVLEAPPITTYTGPTVGVSSMAHAPTVGYYWSLEPGSGK